MSGFLTWLSGEAGLPRGLVWTLGQLSEHARPLGTSAEQTVLPSAHLNPLLEVSVDGRETAQEPAAKRAPTPPGVCSGDGEGAENPELIVSDLSCKKWPLAVGGTLWRDKGPGG